MGKTGKRILSLFLAFVMLLTSLSVGLTAFANQANWNRNNISRPQLADYIVDIANRLWGPNGDSGTYNDIAYQNNILSGYGASAGYGLRGTYFKDNANGDLYAILQDAWAILATMNVGNAQGQGDSTNIDTHINNYITQEVQNYMGTDFKLTYWGNNDPWYFRSLFGWKNDAGLPNGGSGGGLSGQRYSTNIVIDLHHDYYLWNSYGDNLASLPSSPLITTYVFLWECQNSSLFSNQTKRIYALYPNAPYRAVLVNSDELKAFGNLFTPIWSDFAEHNFDAIDENTQMEILTTAPGLLSDIQNNTHTDRLEINRGNEDTEYQDLSTNAQATADIFAHYFAPYATYNQHWDAFLRYMVQKFIDAVDNIRDTYFKPDRTIKNDLSLDELREMKRLIEIAYTMWDNFPDVLRQISDAADAKNRLDGYYYKPSDSVNSSTTFVTEWNNKISQAYIEVVEKLEYASDIYDKSASDYEKYVIETKREANTIKALLDEADALWGDLVWETSYEDNATRDGKPGYADLTRLSSSLTFKSTGPDYERGTDDDTNITGGAAALAYARDVHKGDGTTYSAQVTYDRWLLRYFLQTAEENLGEYLQGNAVVIPGNLTVLDIVPIRSKINRVTNAYNDLPDRFKGLPEVEKWMNIIWGNNGNNLQTALDKLLQDDSWKPYDGLEYPYYYNWDEKHPEITIDKNYLTGNEVENLFNNVSALLQSPAFKNLLKDENGNPLDLATFADNMLVNLLTGESANNIIKTILMLLMPLIQGAMYDARIDVDAVVVVIHTTVMQAQRSGLKILGGNYTLDVMYPDPNMLRDKIAQYTSNQNSLAAAAAIGGTGGTNWDYVNWDVVDWKIETVDEFCNVMGGILRCISKLVRSLLFDEKAVASLTGTLAGLLGGAVDLTISKWKNSGYEKDILPMLEAIGITGLPTNAQAKQMADNDDWANLLKTLVNAIRDRIKELLTGDVLSNIISILPNLSYLLLFDKITGTSAYLGQDQDGGPGWNGNADNGYYPDASFAGLTDLLSPLSKLAGLSLEGFGLTNGISADFIMDTINGMLESTGFHLPDINWAMIAGLGQMGTKSSSTADNSQRWITANPHEIFVYFINYIASVISENEDAIYNLLFGALSTDNAALGELIDQLFSHFMATANDPQAFGAVLFELVRAVNTQDYNWTDTWDWKQFLVDFNDSLKYNREEVENAVDKLTAIVGNVVNNFLFKDEEGNKLTLKEFLDGNVFTGSLINTLFKTIYSLDSDMIRTIFSFVYVTDANGASRTIDMKPSTIASVLQSAGFGAVASAINGRDYYVTKDENGEVTYSVFDNITDDMWGINDSETFRKALVAILDPFKYNIGTILAGDRTEQGGSKGSTSVGGVININGYNGYRNGLKAVMAVFGSGLLDGTTLISETEFESNPNGSLDMITKMLFELIDAYCEDPLGSIIQIVPQVASFIHNGGLQNSLAQVIQPLWNVLSAVLDLFQINNDIVPDTEELKGGNNHTFFKNEQGSPNNLINVIIDAVFQEENSQYRDQITWDNIHEHIFDFVNQFLKGIIEIDGKKYDLEIPGIDWYDLGGSGERSTEDMKIDPDEPSVVVKVLRWVWRVVQTNGDTIEALIHSIGEDGTVGAIYDVVTNYISLFDDEADNYISEDDFVNLVVKIVNGLDSSNWDSTSIWEEILDYVVEEATDVEYPWFVEEERYHTPEEVDELVEFISNIAVGVLKNFLGLDLSDVNASLYTSMLPVLITQNLYPVLDSAASVFDILDISFTFEDFITALESDYPEIAAAINGQTYTDEETGESGAVDSFAKIDWSAIEEANMFGVSNAQTLSQALAFVLDPFMPVLKFLFNAGEFNIMGIVPLTGSYGYRNAILPLFTALGIYDDASTYGAKNARDYSSDAEADSKNILINIIEPIFKWLDEALAFGDDGSGPVGALFSVLPELAALIDNGGIQQFIQDLTYPISNLVDNILFTLTEDPDVQLFSIVFDFAMAMLAGGNVEEEEPEDEGIVGTVKKALEAIFGKGEEEEITWSTFHKHLFDIAAMVLDIASVDKDGNLTITITINDEELTILVPDYKDLLAKLAGVDGSDPTKKITDSLLLVWQYIWDDTLNGISIDDTTTMDSIKALLANLLGDAYDTEVAGYALSRYLGNLLTSEANEIVAALIQMMGALDSSDYIKTDDFYGEDGILTDPFAGLEELDALKYPALKDASAGAESPEYYYNVEDVKELVDTLSSLIKSAIMIISGTQNADNISINLLYNDEMMGTIANLIGSLADNNIVKTVLSLFGVDLSVETLVDKLNYYGYTALADEVAKYESLSEVPWVDQYYTDEEGNYVDANGDPSDEPVLKAQGIQNLWYVTDQAAFLANVYNSSAEGAQIPEANVNTDTEILGHYRFAKALAVMLSPFSDLLNTLLNAGTTMIADTIEFTGAPSYGNAIKPLLDAFSANTASIEDYAEKTAENSDYVLFYLLDPLLAKVDTLIKDPANTLFGMLPQLAAFFDNGGLEMSLMNMLYPITQLIDPIFRLVFDEEMIKDMAGEGKEATSIYDIAVAFLGMDCSFNELHDYIFEIVAKLIGESDDETKLSATYNDDGDLILSIPINGVKTNIVIPAYELAKIAGCGVSDEEDKKVTDAFIVVFRYIEKILRVNEKSVLDVVEGLVEPDMFEAIKTYISNVLNPPTEEAQVEKYVNDSLLITLIRVVQNLKTADFETDELWQEIGKLPENVEAPFEEADGEYRGLQLDQVTSAIKTLSNAVSSALKVFADLDLANFTEDTIYSNEIISLVASIIFPLADNNTINVILGMLGVDLSKDNVEELFRKYGYVEIADLIKAADKLSDIQWADETDEEGNVTATSEVSNLWYVTDAEGFETNVWNSAVLKSEDYTVDQINTQYRFTRALVAVLAPFADLIGVLLLPYDLGDDATNSIKIADGSLEIDGAFGYRNAIMPLLEAIKAPNVKSSEEYVDMAKKDSVYILFNILDPLLSKVDEILTDPVNELLAILPRISNYLKDGGLQLTIQNLLYPLTTPLDPIVKLIMGDIQGEDEVKVSDIYNIVLDYFAGDYSDKFTWETAHEDLYDIAAAVINNLADKEDEFALSAKVDGDGNLIISNLVKFENEDGSVDAYDITIPALIGENGLLTRLARGGNPLDLSEYGDEDLTGTRTKDQAAANSFLTLIEWIWEVVNDNEETIRDIVENHLLGEEKYEALLEYIDNLFDNDKEDVAKAVVAVLNSLDASGYYSKNIWNVILDTTDLEPTDVPYPVDGYTAQDINDTVTIISEVLINVLTEFANIDITGITGEFIYQDSNITAIAKIILSLSDIETVTDIFSFVGEDLSKDHIAELLETVSPSAAAAIRAAETAKDIDWDSVTWSVTDRESFVEALVAVISPLEPVLAYFLTAGTIDINGVVALTGSHGYKNAVKYLLEEGFGIEGLEDEYEDITTLLTDVINAFLNMVDEILADPDVIGAIVDIIPQLAKFINAGGVQQFVHDLIYPIINFAEPIVALISDQGIFDTVFDILSALEIFDIPVSWENAHNEILELVNDMVLEDLVIKIGDYELKLKLNTDITWAGLAGCGIIEGGEPNPDLRPDTILYILYYVWSNVEENREAIDGLIDSLLPEEINETFGGYIDNVLDREDMEIVQAIVDVFKAFDTSEHEADWSFLTNGYASDPIDNYESDELPVSKADIEALITQLNDVALKAIKEFVLKEDFADLAEFLGNKLYTADLVLTVRDALNELANNDTVVKILDLLGVTLTVNNNDYSSVNDKDSFIEAMAEVLAPFDSIVAALLEGEPLTIANTITIKAANGFENAIKPLLEYAFGVEGVTDASIEGLLTAVLGRVDEILDKPVDEILELIPMLVNFINEGGVQYFVEELLYPVITLITPIFNLIKNEEQADLTIFDFALELLPEFVDFDLKGTLGFGEEDTLTWEGLLENIPDIVNGFLKGITINGESYDFTVNELDFDLLASRGELNDPDDYTVNGDKADTFVTIFQIIWDIVKENRNNIDSILDSVLSDELKEYVGGYIENVLDKEYGDIVKALVDLFKGFDSSGHTADWSILLDGFEAQDVEYSDAVPKTDVEFLVESIGKLADNALAEYLLEDADSLVEFLSQKLYTKELIDTIQGVINGLADNGTIMTILGLLGIELEVNDTDYTVTDKTSFITALVDILKPFEDVVNAFLTEGQITVAGVITITGSNGFDNALKPLLEYALGADVADDTQKTLEGLLTALLDRVDEILEAPVEEVLKLIPTLANFIDKGGVQNFIYELLYPIIHMLSPILALIQPEPADDEEAEEIEFFDFVLDVVQGFVDIKGMLKLDEATELTWDGLFDLIPTIADGFLKEITINGETYTFTVSKSLTLKKLAECGTNSGVDGDYKIAGDSADTFVTIFDLIWAIVDENEDTIDDLITNVLGDGKVKDIAGKYIENLLGADSDDVLKALVGVFRGLNSEAHKADWSFLVKEDAERELDAHENIPVVYNNYDFDKDDVKDLIEKLSVIADNALEAYVLDDAASLGEFLANKLYTADTVNAIINVLNGLVDNSTVKMILGLLGVDLEVQEEVTGIDTKEDFVNALVDVLAPFEGVVNAFLKSGTISIAGVLDITGSNGFDNAIKPLLEYAFGATVTEEATLKGLLNAVINRVDEILESPVEEVLALIPTLANFIVKGGIQQFVEELLYPVITILRPIIDLIQTDPKYDIFDFALNLVDDILTVVKEEEFKLKDTLGVENLTWKGISSQIPEVVNHFLTGITINDSEYSFTVNALDFDLLASRGTNSGNDGDYTINGKDVTADTFVTIFMIIWDIVEENRPNIDSILDGVLSDELKEYVGGYINNALDSTDDEIINALIELFNGFDSSGHKADWSFLTDEYTPQPVVYTDLEVTEAEVTELIATLSTIVENVINEFILKEDYASLAEFIGGMLYTQDLIDTIQNAINGLANDDTLRMVLSLLGVELAENTSTYTITDKDSFINALAEILAPFEPLIDALLGEGELLIAKVLPIKGADGFNNAVKPLIEYALGGTAGTDADIKGILTAVLARLDAIVADPVGEALALIPMLTNFINEGGVQYFVSELLYPIIQIVTPILDLVKDDDQKELGFFDFALDVVQGLELVDLKGILGFGEEETLTWENALSHIPQIVNGFLEGITINESEYSFTVNALDFILLASRGIASGYVVDGDKEDTFVTIFMILWQIVQENKEALEDILEGVLGEETFEKVGGYIDSVLDKEYDEVLAALIELLNGMDSSSHVADWNFLTNEDTERDIDEYESKPVEYDDLAVSKDEVATLIDAISAIAESAINELLLKDKEDIENLAQFVGSMLYKQDLVDTIQNAINGLAADETVGTILDLIGVTLTENTNVYTVTDKDSFIAALADILAPFTPVIDVILNKGTLDIAGVIEITGADGYNNAVKPLLEYALGATEFTDGSLEGILTALLDRVDEILENPVDEVLELIPMLTNFINKGGVQYFVEELIYPVINLITPIFNLIKGEDQADLTIFDFALELLPEFVDIDLKGILGFGEEDTLTWDDLLSNIPQIVNGFLEGITINESEYTFTVNSLDFALLASRGVANGLVVDGDREDTFVTIFMILWDIVDENSDALLDIVKGLLGDEAYENVGGYIENVLDKDCDDVLKALVDVFKGLDSSDHTADWSFLTNGYTSESPDYNGFTKDDVQNLIDILSAIAENALTLLLEASGYDSFEALVDGTIADMTAFNDLLGTISELMNSLAENGTVTTILDLVGIELTELPTEWNVTSLEEIIDALATVLAPFETVINVFLNKGELDIAGVLTIKGADGLNNAIRPLLEYALGITGVPDNAGIKEILTTIVNAEFDLINDPVNGILGMIPSLANFINKGGIQYFVEELLYPVLNVVDPLLALIKDKDSDDVSIFDFAFGLIDIDSVLGVEDVTWDNIQTKIVDIVNGFLEGITINGGEYSFTVNALDLAALAACGKTIAGSYAIDGDDPDTFVTLFGIIWGIVQENREAIDGILDSVLTDDIKDIAGDYIDNVLGKDADDVLKALIDVFNGLDSSDHKADWSFLTDDHASKSPEYPGDLNADDVQAIIDVLAGIAENALAEYILKGDYASLADYVGGMLYTQDLVDTIKNALNSLAENGTVIMILDLLGVELEVNNSTYTINSKADFIAALADILAPFEDVISVFLSTGEINIAGVLPIKGADGFNNAIKPLLEYALGATDVTGASLEDILTVLLDRVDEILADPVNEVLGLIPTLANFINEGGIQYFLEELLFPVLNIAAPIVELITDDDDVIGFALSFVDLADLLGVEDVTWDNIQTKIPEIVNGFLEGITINGGKYNFTVNSLDLAALAACGTADGFAIDGNDPDTFITLFGIIWDIIQENKEAIDSIVDSLDMDDWIKDIISNLLDNDKEDVIEAIVDALSRLDSSAHIADWRFLTDGYKAKSPKYPDGVTSGDVADMIEILSGIIENAISEFILGDDYASLSDFLGGILYTDDMINTIVDALNSLPENNIANIILVTVLGVEFPIENKGWNVTDRESFIDALVEILAPFEDVVNALLNSGTINVAGVVDVTGADGFNNAIKPLLEYALGCDEVTDSSLRGIITALLDRVDEILADPLNELLGLIPMLTNFINKGGVQYFLEELLYPVVNIAEPILPLITDGSLFDLILFDIIGLDLGVDGLTFDNITDKLPEIINGFLEGITINGDQYDFTVNALDFAALAACGKANNLVVEGNDPDTFITLFGIIWAIVQENRSAVDDIIDSLLSEDLQDMLGEYIDHVLGKDSNSIVKALVQIIKGLDASKHVADWSFLFKNYKQTKVKYPSGVTSGDIEEVIDILTVAIENALSIFLDTSLPELVGGIVYTNDIISAVQNVINSLAENETVKTVLGLLGLEITTNNKTYKVTDKASFAAALADVLAPLEPVLNAFLNKGEITIAGVVTIKGADGFNNAVKPLLEYALGCTNVKSSSLKGIINAVLDRVEEILASPIEEIVDLLPLLSNFIAKGGVQYFVEELFYPVLNIADAVIALITDDDLFTFVFDLLGVDLDWNNLQNEIIPLVNSMLTNIKINGKSYSITIPEIDWSKLGGCGKVGRMSLTANQGDTVMTVLRYIFKALEANKNIIYDLVGNNATIKQIVTNILNQGADGMAKIIVTILLKMETFDNVTWTFKNIKHVDTTYTPGYTDEEYHTMIIEGIDEAIFGLIGGLVDLDVGSLLNDLVYKNSIVNTVAKLVYTNLEKISVGGISIHQILKALDLDITTASVAKMLSDFGSASREIGSKATWADVNFDNINWNFTDGDKTGFINGLAAALRPIQPLIRVILSGEDLIVLGSIHIKGGDGYNTAVIPLLEALCVDPANLVSPQQYAKEANTDKVLTSILTPILDKVEELLNRPIYTLCDMLPNIAYFLLNGGARDLVENIAGPVFNLLAEVAPIYDLDIDKLLLDNIGFGLSSLEDLDLDGLVNQLLSSIKINGQPLGIRITDIDLETLAGRGELVNYTSARTYYGTRMNCKRIDSDRAAVLVSVLRYIVNNLQANLDEIVALLEGIGLSGDIANMVNQVLEMLTSMDVDGVIDAILELLFPKGGTDGDGNDGNGSNFQLGDNYWLYWPVFGGVMAFLILFLIVIFKKKEKEEEEEVTENINAEE